MNIKSMGHFETILDLKLFLFIYLFILFNLFYLLDEARFETAS